MYSKLSYLFLVGLISQSIAAPNSIYEFIVNETNREDFMRSYAKDCVQRYNSSNFGLKSLESQIDKLLDNYDVLSLDKIAEQVETVFDNLIDGLDKDNFAEIVEQANEDLISVVTLGKDADLNKILKIVDKSSKKLMEILKSRKIDSEEIHSLTSKLIITVMKKEYPKLFRYSLHFLQNITDVIDRYQESDNFHEVAEALRLTIEQAQREIKNPPNVTSNNVFESIVIQFDGLADEISFFFGMDMSDDSKFSAVRCLAEDAVVMMLMQAFMIGFPTAIDL